MPSIFNLLVTAPAAIIIFFASYFSSFTCTSFVPVKKAIIHKAKHGDPTNVMEKVRAIRAEVYSHEDDSVFADKGIG